MNKKFGQILLPFITPFRENGEVDMEAFIKLVDYAMDRNLMDSIILTGTTGEFNTLSFDERVAIFETICKHVGKKVPVIAGTGCASAWETIKLTNAAYEIGIDTVMIVGPYYCKPTQQGISLYYQEILSKTKSDILIYNIPIFTGTNIEPETLAGLVKEDMRIIGIKDESGVNPIQILDYYYATKDIRPEFLLYNGDDIMLMSTLALGAHGVISGCSLVLGDQVRKVFENYHGGRPEQALEAFKNPYRLVRCLGINGRIHPNPMLRKAVEYVSGIKVGQARLPLDTPTPQECDALKSLLTELGL